MAATPNRPTSPCHRGGPCGVHSAQLSRAGLLYLICVMGRTQPSHLVGT